MAETIEQRLSSLGVTLPVAAAPAANYVPFMQSSNLLLTAGQLPLKDGKLAISKTPNGENPLVHGASPILGVDVWEHSYYIDYRNARPKYLEAFVDSLINWDYVLELYEKAKA